jgi:hypothetical protein
MRFSIIIPHCHGVQSSNQQRQELESLLSRIDHEILCKFSGCPTIEHAIVAGVRAARGQAVAVIEPGERYPVAQLAGLLRGLSRADFVCGRRRRQGWPKLAERLARLPRWLLLGLDARDPGCLFWAARREVFNDLQLVPRFVRHLPALVARQGFRVDSVYVEERMPARTAGPAAPPSQPAAPHVASANLLSAWWTCHKLRRAERVATLRADATHVGQRTAFTTEQGDASEPYKAKSA